MAARSRGGSTPRKRQQAPPKTDKRSLKRKRNEEDFDKLEKAAADLDPKSPELKKFADLPLCEATASGLRASHFEVMTDIQRLTIPLGLKGSDILGAAKTGSGKTLAFLVPMLEKLYRARWTEYDGLGALVLSPTRELAVQTFEVLRKIGRNHTFSAGLVIGGKSLKEEADRLTRMNILVGTPGRILQHLDQTAGFDVSNLQMLVLDEADRIMDMGFQRDVDALIEHLPKARQTLLFSATQSKRVSDLARLSLKEPEYVSAHAEAVSATPSGLQQFYAVTPVAEKLASLWGFLKSNLKSKMIVFLSSGKQVRFVFEAFKRMQPGMPLLHLHGRQRQSARLEITARFTAMKAVCLIATDVVARGVDFPQVKWVVQMDCPEDAETYIHRVGRTARYESDGRSVLFLDPSEEAGFLKRLEQKKIPIQKVHVREKKKKDITDQIQAMCFQNPDLKYLAQKSFICYTRSIYLQKDKEVFKLDQLNLDEFAASLGLPGAPQIKFQPGEDWKKLKNMSRAALSSGSDTDDLHEEGQRKKRKKDEVRTKVQKMMERQNQDVLSSHYKKLVNEDDDLDDADLDFLSVKRVLKYDDPELDAQEEVEGGGRDDGVEPKVVTLGKTQFVVDSNRREKALKSKKKMLKYMDRGAKLVFDDDGNAHPIYELQDEDDFRQEGPADALRQRFVDAEAERVREADVEDKELAKQKRREKRIRRKERERAEMDGEGGMVVRLPSPGDEDGEGGFGDDGAGYSDGGDEVGEAEARAPPRTKTKKWFEDDSEADESRKVKQGKKARVMEVDQPPETLEDYEALATGLLDD